MSKEGKFPWVPIRDTVLLVGLVTAGIPVARSVNEDLRGAENHNAEIVRNSYLKEYVTDEAGDFNQIPLRKSPKLGDDEIIGWTVPGQTFEAQEVYGVTYPSDTAIGNFTYDGRSYGSWYKGEGLLVFEKNEEGKLVPVIDENGQQKVSQEVYIAGNFLRLPTEEEVNKLPDAR